MSIIALYVGVIVIHHHGLVIPFLFHRLLTVLGIPRLFRLPPLGGCPTYRSSHFGTPFALAHYVCYSASNTV